MASRANLTWKGDKLAANLAAAARISIDETLREADDDASASHWWVNRTGNLEENIVTEAAAFVGDKVVGRFGTTHGGKGVRSGFYGLFLEYKTTFLRSAADRTFPTLREKIARRLLR